MKDLIKRNAASTITGSGLFIALLLAGSQASAQEAEVLELATGQYGPALALALSAVVALATAWKEHLKGHEARADKAEAKIEALEKETQELRERALKAELLAPKAE